MSLENLSDGRRATPRWETPVSDTITADGCQMEEKDYQQPPEGAAPLSSPPKKSANKDDEELVDAIASWHATPEPLRNSKTLNGLAKELNIHAGGIFYALAHSPEVYHRMLVKTAGSALKLAPHILYVLGQKALEGHHGCAKIYLDFVRLVLTDEKIIQTFAPKRRERAELIQDVEAGAQEMLNLADKLGEEEGKALKLLKDNAHTTA